MILGGGVSGICAAIQAARAGAVTCIVEKNGVCGGTLTAAGVDCPGLFNAWGKQIIAGIGWELIKKTLLECGEPVPDFKKRDMSDFPSHQVRVNALIFACLAEEELKRAGVELNYHTMPAALERKNGLWKVTLCRKDGLCSAEARIVVDCTGDANGVRLAGFPCREPFPCQPGTMSVLAEGFDQKALDAEKIEQAFQEALRRGEVLPDDFGWSANVGQFLSRHGKNSNHIDCKDAFDSPGKSRLECAGRECLLRAYRFLRKQPGMEHLRFTPIAWECGVRESRTVIGETTITVDDYISGRKFSDALCNSFYPVDLHDSAIRLDVRKLQEDVVATVPRGALIPAGSSGLLAAGRIISSDRAANSALRIQATCMATGQAVGAMAALCSRMKCEALELPLEMIRSFLKQNGAILPQVK